MYQRVWIISLGLVFTVGACGDDAAGMDADIPDATMEAGPPDAEVPDADIPDAEPMGDGNDTFDAAQMVMLGEDVEGAISEPGDLDYYQFTATAGDWIRVDTDANPDDEGDMIDTVLTLYDSSQTQIAENNDSFPGSSLDSEIYYHIPADGTYYLLVQEESTWSGADTVEGQEDFTYTVKFAEVNEGSRIVAVDPEMGDGRPGTSAAFSSQGFNLTVGTFRDNTDIDVYVVNIFRPMRLSSYVMPWGSDGYGSTTSAGRLWVTNPSDEIVARIDNRVTDWNRLNVPMPSGTFWIWVEHPGTVEGSNDFYVLKNFLSTSDNTPEAEEATNGTLAGAEALMQDEMDPRRSAYLLAYLGDGDVDYYSFEVRSGERISVACGGYTSGSGVRDLLVEIRDDADMTLMSAMEVPPDNAYIPDAMITTPGTYYLRLTKGSQDPEIVGNFVRCGLRASSS